METGEQHSARGGLSLLLLMLGVIGCEPPQSQPTDTTANSAEPGALPAVTVGAGPEQDKGFLEWCQDAAAPDEVRYTVTVLLAYVETEDCLIAADSLATYDELDLENFAVTREYGLDDHRPPAPAFARLIAERPVRDLRPISRMTNLRVLDLEGNQVDDLAPLASLHTLEVVIVSGSAAVSLDPLRDLGNLEVVSVSGSAAVSLDPLRDLGNLRELSIYAQGIITDVSAILELRSLTDLRLRGGQIGDLGWLRQLPQLTYLSLDGNQITDLTPLAELTGLENLYLSNNRIRDVQPLAGLHRLRHLRLINNEVVDVTPLAGLTNLVTLWLEGNQITDVSSLNTLVRAGLLALGDNPLLERRCPLPRPRVAPDFPSCSF